MRCEETTVRASHTIATLLAADQFFTDLAFIAFILAFATVGAEPLPSSWLPRLDKIN